MTGTTRVWQPWEWTMPTLDSPTLYSSTRHKCDSHVMCHRLLAVWSFEPRSHLLSRYLHVHCTSAASTIPHLRWWYGSMNRTSRLETSNATKNHCSLTNGIHVYNDYIDVQYVLKTDIYKILPLVNIYRFSTYWLVFTVSIAYLKIP